MLIRYCAAHPEHFGYPRLLGVRWKGWTVRTFGTLCDACRERDRGRWNGDPYAALIPIPVELGPRLPGRRFLGALLAAIAAAAVTMATLLVVSPPGLGPMPLDLGRPVTGVEDARPANAEAERAVRTQIRGWSPVTEPVSSAKPKTSAPRHAKVVRATFTQATFRHHSAPKCVAPRRCPPRVGPRAAFVGATRPIVGAQSP